LSYERTNSQYTAARTVAVGALRVRVSEHTDDRASDLLIASMAGRLWQRWYVDDHRPYALVEGPLSGAQGGDGFD